MSGLIAPKEAELTLLEYIVGNTTNQPTGAGQVLKLFSNTDAAFPATTSHIGDFTEIGTTSGYSAQVLTYADWGFTSVSGVITATYASEITFNFTTAVNVYGYYVVSADTRLLWCERFTSAPFSMPNSGGTIAIRPQLQLN